MIHGVKLTTEGITPQQMRIRLRELGGIPLTEWEQREVEIPSDDEDELLDLDEILREMGFGDDDDDEVEFDTDELDFDELGEYVYRVLSNQELNEGKVMVDGIPNISPREGGRARRGEARGGTGRRQARQGGEQPVRWRLRSARCG